MSPQHDEPVGERLDEARRGIEWLGKMEAGDFELEERLGTVLRLGVRASSAALALGLLISLTLGNSDASRWLMTGGLVMLMATPVARVAMSVYEYATHRDWTFFTLTAIVLLELCAGIVAALVFHTKL